MADQSAKFFDGNFFPPKREDAFAETARTLAETTANLDAYIEHRAQEIAAPRIAEARKEYVRIRDDRSRKHAAEVQRLNDLVDELRRQVDIQVRRAERAEKQVADLVREATDD